MLSLDEHLIDQSTTHTATTMAPRLPARCWAPAARPTRSSASALVAGIQPTSLAMRPALLPPQTSPAAALTPHHHQHQQTRGIRYGWSSLDSRFDKPPSFKQKYNKGPGLPPLTTTPEAARERKSRSTPLRTGVLATKKGMTAYYTRNGKRMACTVLQMDQCQVVAHKSADRHGYYAVQVGCGERRADNLTAPLLGYYEAKGVPPKESLVEFHVRGEDGLAPPVGVQLMPDWFHKGQWVDVRAQSRGMGFEGGMKRHGFSGQEASHGNSKNHRTIGSAGASQGSGSRVLPGKKMPGRMGNERVTMQNLAVLRVDNDLGIIVVKGCIGGPKGGLVMISDAVKKPPPPPQFIEKMNKALNERFPNAVRDLEAARAVHLKLKQMRKEGRIEEALKTGLREGEGILAESRAEL